MLSPKACQKPRPERVRNPSQPTFDVQNLPHNINDNTTVVTTITVNIVIMIIMMMIITIMMIMIIIRFHKWFITRVHVCLAVNVHATCGVSRFCHQ